MYVLVADVSRFVEELPDSQLALEPFLGSHAVYMGLRAFACPPEADFQRLDVFSRFLSRHAGISSLFSQHYRTSVKKMQSWEAMQPRSECLPSEDTR